mmetsp:Transcript_30061/g.53304  ORF Transcript_30061/g.53304 Transcript_30061/m.53304 type:complete len:171 (-) Transcript_30061:11-523(-)
MELNPDEVESFRWTSFQYFTHDFLKIAKPKYITIDDWFIQRVLQTFKIKSQPQIECFVGGALLPLKPEFPALEPMADSISEFHLWGITYRRVRALVLLLDKSERGTRKLDWIYYRVKGMYWFTSPFLTFGELVLLVESAKLKHIYMSSAFGLLSVLTGSILGYALIKPKL